MGAHGGLPAISTDNLNANHHDSGGNDRDVLDSRVLSKKSSDGKPIFCTLETQIQKVLKVFKFLWERPASMHIR